MSRTKKTCTIPPPRPPRELCNSWWEWILGILSPSKHWYWKAHSEYGVIPTAIPRFFDDEKEWQWKVMVWKIETHQATREEWCRYYRKERKMKSADEHRKKMLERQSQLLSDLLTGDIEDTDIWNLEMMITEIAPGSRAWRSGHIRSLRRAIKALQRENQERRRSECEPHIDPG